VSGRSGPTQGQPTTSRLCNGKIRPSQEDEQAQHISWCVQRQLRQGTKKEEVYKNVETDTQHGVPKYLRYYFSITL
jgi:hypothetical protein